MMEAPYWLMVGGGVAALFVGWCVCCYLLSPWEEWHWRTLVTLGVAVLLWLPIFGVPASIWHNHRIADAVVAQDATVVSQTFYAAHPDSVLLHTDLEKAEASVYSLVWYGQDGAAHTTTIVVVDGKVVEIAP